MGKDRRRRGWAVAATVVAVLAAGGCSQPNGQQDQAQTTQPVCGQGVPAGGSAGTPVSVPITVSGKPYPVLPTVLVTIGKAAPVPLLLDTGSVGLRVFTRSLGSLEDAGVSVTDTPISVEFGSGDVYNGRCATAGVRIGGLSTTSGAVPFQLVDSVTCGSANPNCPNPEAPGGTAGILGIGLHSDALPNVLDYLPGVAGHWSVHLDGDTGQFLLGANSPASPIASFSLSGQGEESVIPTWDDHAVNLCWSIGPAAPTCVPTMFDSGAVNINLWDQALAREAGVTPSPAGTRVPAGIPITVSAPGGQAFWNWESGSLPGNNLVFAQTNPFQGAGNAAASTGVSVYFRFTVTYDARSGTIHLS